MAKTVQDYLNVLRSWIGKNEKDGSHMDIVNIYNNDKPLPIGYKVKRTDSWCDVTVSAAAIVAGIKDLVGKECGCERHIQIFKNMGIWIEDGTITPKVGDIILYNWDVKAQPNDGFADHIGVVESVSNGQITCIEGNKNDAVGRRVISVGNGYIRGYARPRYAGGAPDKPVVKPESNGKGINKTVLFFGRVNASELNVRTWAGTENPKLKSKPTLKQGTRVGVCDTVNDKHGDPWYYICIDGVFGFVSAMYITKLEESKPSKPVSNGGICRTPQWTGVVTADVLNVRTWAGTNNPTLKSIPQISRGKKVDVCDSVNAVDGSKWYYIRIDGEIFGFVHSAYIKRA